MSLEAPESVRNKHWGQMSAKDLDQAIRSEIQIVLGPADLEPWETEGKGVASEDLSGAMCRFIPNIKRLAQLPDGLQLAFDLVIHLGESSYGELDEEMYSDWDFGCAGLERGWRPSDDKTDELLVMLATQLSERQLPGSPWFPHKQLAVLRRASKNMYRHGVEDYSSRSVQLLDAYERYMKAADNPSIAKFERLFEFDESSGEYVRRMQKGEDENKDDLVT